MGLMGRGLGRVLKLVGFRESVLQQNLELAFGKEMSAEQIIGLKRKVYSHIGLLFLEILRNFSVSKRQMLEEVEFSDENKKKIDGILSSGKCAVFVTAHIGNWELFAMGMAARGYPVVLIVKKMNNFISQQLVSRLRQRSGVDVIYSGGTIEKMRLALADGKTIGFMVDQNVTGTKGIRANFFGTPAASIHGLARLAKETLCPIVPICAYRLASGKLRVTVFEPLPYLEAPEFSSPEERQAREDWLNAQQYQNAMEQMIRLHPDQWMWIHRRWKANRTPLIPGKEHISL